MKCTCISHAKQVFPLWDDKAINHLLFEATCFPVGDCEIVKSQIDEYAGLSMKEIMERVDRQIKEIKYGNEH